MPIIRINPFSRKLVIRMEEDSWDSIKMGREMEMGVFSCNKVILNFLIVKMEMFMKESGLTTKYRGKGYTSSHPGLFTEESSSIT